MRMIVIDDDKSLGRSLQIHMERAGHSVDTAHLGGDGLKLLCENGYDLAFIDLNLPDMSGMEILRKFREIRNKTLTVMITGMQDSKSTIEAIRLGAFDYIRKPLDLDAVIVTVEKAQQYFRHGSPGKFQRVDAAAVCAPYEIVGSHPRVIEVLKQIALTAESQVPVLIQGETGTGKELVARALHDASTPGEPFVAVNCSAIVPTLLESELFGHVKGAFTGADSDKPGKLESAAGGTLFFDEIGDMTYDLQAKLLRVLQERVFERVGSSKSLPFRARVVAATHRDIKSMVSEQTFRDDLYYRLAVSTIHVPALRERRSDIAELAENMLARLSHELHRNVEGISDAALRMCESYDWPGNIRELNNVLTRALLLSRGAIVGEECVQAALGVGGTAVLPPGDLRPLREVEREYVSHVLRCTGGNISKASEILDITRVTLRKKIEDFGIEKF